MFKDIVILNYWQTGSINCILVGVKLLYNAIRTVKEMLQCKFRYRGIFDKRQTGKSYI